MRLLPSASVNGLLAVTLCLAVVSAGAAPVFSLDSDTARIDALEDTLFGKTSGNAAAEKRMSAIEKSVFGRAKQGTIKQRLDAVSKIVDAGSSTKLMPPEAPAKDALPVSSTVKQGRVEETEVKTADYNKMLNEGIKLESEGKTNEAVNLFHQVISMDHYNANAFFNLGVVAEKHGDFNGALQNYRIAASINPQDREFQEAVAAMDARLNPGQPVFAVPPYMVPQLPVYQQPYQPPPIVSVSPNRPPEIGVTQPRRGHPYLRAAATAAAIGAVVGLGAGGFGGIDIGCPLCRMLGGL